MIVYHGTVDAYLPSIEKSGLKVIPQHRFHAEKDWIFGTVPMPLEKGIYVTQLKTQATNFARYRALWSGLVIGAGIGSDFTGGETLYKTGGDVIKDAKPVILTIELSPELTHKLIPDERSEDKAKSFWLPSVIPASAIIAKEEVSGLDFAK